MKSRTGNLFKIQNGVNDQVLCLLKTFTYLICLRFANYTILVYQVIYDFREFYVPILATVLKLNKTKKARCKTKNNCGTRVRTLQLFVQETV